MLQSVRFGVNHDPQIGTLLTNAKNQFQQKVLPASSDVPPQMTRFVREITAHNRQFQNIVATLAADPHRGIHSYDYTA